MNYPYAETVGTQADDLLRVVRPRRHDIVPIVRPCSSAAKWWLFDALAEMYTGDVHREVTPITGGMWS